jgi:hypothetical protein
MDRSSFSPDSALCRGPSLLSLAELPAPSRTLPATQLSWFTRVFAPKCPVPDALRTTSHALSWHPSTSEPPHVVETDVVGRQVPTTCFFLLLPPENGPNAANDALKGQPVSHFSRTTNYTCLSFPIPAVLALFVSAPPSHSQPCSVQEIEPPSSARTTWSSFSPE